MNGIGIHKVWFGMEADTLRKVERQVRRDKLYVRINSKKVKCPLQSNKEVLLFFSVSYGRVLRHLNYVLTKVSIRICSVCTHRCTRHELLC